MQNMINQSKQNQKIQIFLRNQLNGCFGDCRSGTIWRVVDVGQKIHGRDNGNNSILIINDKSKRVLLKDVRHLTEGGALFDFAELAHQNFGHLVLWLYLVANQPSHHISSEHNAQDSTEKDKQSVFVQVST